jgi:hypothetical protein
MMHFIFGVGPFVLLLVSLGADWIKISMVKRFAQENGMGDISANPFNRNSLASFQEIKRKLPQGALRTRVRLFEISSIVFGLAFAGLMILSIWNK